MLLTDWVTIGTAGDTVDGRVISEQDLKDAAETYDREEYTAILNSEHALSWYGNFGRVHELQNGTDKKGRTILQAKLAPNKRLIEMNSNGQRMFTSMELQKNFAQTGKTYLTGLAMVDDPASLGTTMIKFSKQDNDCNPLISKPDSFSLEKPEQKKHDSDHEPNGLIDQLRTFLQSQPVATLTLAEDGDAMNKEQFEEFKSLQEQTLEATKAMADAIKAFAVKPAAEEKKPEPKKEEPQAEAEKTELSEIKDALKTLTEDFAALKQEAPGTKVPAGTGAAKTQFI